MKVLIACEFSGITREAFAGRGHDSWSCDLLDTEKPGNHIVGNCLDILSHGWDLMICHPPCTYLAVSGARWFKEREREQLLALAFVRRLLNAPIKKICLENPVSVISTKIRKPDQIIQPWMFGHQQQKTTCLWLNNLPSLKPTDVVDRGRFVTQGGKNYQPWMSNSQPGEHVNPEARRRRRSRQFTGIAEAMADQWGVL